MATIIVMTQVPGAVNYPARPRRSPGVFQAGVKMIHRRHLSKENDPSYDLSKENDPSKDGISASFRPCENDLFGRSEGCRRRCAMAGVSLGMLSLG